MRYRKRGRLKRCTKERCRERKGKRRRDGEDIGGEAERDRERERNIEGEREV